MKRHNNLWPEVIDFANLVGAANNRSRNAPGDRNNNIGFRVVVSASTPHCQNRRK